MRNKTRQSPISNFDVSNITKILDSRQSSTYSLTTENNNSSDGEHSNKASPKAKNNNLLKPNFFYLSERSSIRSINDNHIKISNTNTEHDEKNDSKRNFSSVNYTEATNKNDNSSYSISSSFNNLNYNDDLQQKKKKMNQIEKKLVGIKSHEFSTALKENKAFSQIRSTRKKEEVKEVKETKDKEVTPNKKQEVKYEISADKPNSKTSVKIINSLIERKNKIEEEHSDKNILPIDKFNKKYYYLREVDKKRMFLKAEPAIIETNSDKYNFKENFSYVVVNDDKKQLSKNIRKSPSIEKYESLMKSNKFFSLIFS